MPARESTWVPARTIPPFPKLAEDIAVEIVVIGGGIAGLLTAYQLRKYGYTVALLEKDRLVSNATKLTTAFITQSIDTDTTDLIDMLGEKDAKLILDSHGKAIDFIERIVRDEGIDCEFMRVPNYTYANDRKELRHLKEEYAALRQLGIRANLRTEALPGFKNSGGIALPNQAKFHPAKFLSEIVACLVRDGVLLFEKTEVKGIEKKARVKVEANGRTVTADWSVMATYETDERYKDLYFKKGMYKTYVLELEAPKGAVPEGIYEDLDNPYHYFRVDAGEEKDRIILGGEDHRIEVKMNEKKNFDTLREYEREIFGTVYPEVRMWTGPILEPLDGLPLIGEAAPRQLVASAFSGNGMTYGAITAMLLSDIIEGKKSAWRELYDPKRMPNLTQLWKKGRDYTEEFFRGAVANALKKRK